MQITLLAVVTPLPASQPTAVLKTPLVVVKEAATTDGGIEVASVPMAAFTSPVVLLKSAPSPMAALKLPVALL
jgi:hypothetical protein